MEKKDRADMTNIVVSAVTRRIKGAETAPTVPMALIHPKDREVMREGNSSVKNTNSIAHKLLMINRIHPNITISTIACTLISSFTWPKSKLRTPMMRVNKPMRAREQRLKGFLFTRTTTQLQNTAAPISTSPTNIWFTYTSSPILSKLRRLPSYTNSIIISIPAHTKAITRTDLYLNKSHREYPWSASSAGSSAPIMSRSSMVSSSLRLYLAILFKEASSYMRPFLREKWGVSSIMKLKAVTARAGSPIHKPATIFQSGMSRQDRATNDTPSENIICRMMMDLSRKLPRHSSFRKVQWRVMAAFVPYPIRKLPNPTTYRLLPDPTSMAKPRRLITHEANSTFFRPMLSAKCPMRRKPTKEPKQLMDWRREEIHQLEHSMMTPQSRAIEEGIGSSRWLTQNASLSTEHTYSSHVCDAGTSSGVHVNSGTQQKKFNEKSTIAATIHLTLKLANRQY